MVDLLRWNNSAIRSGVNQTVSSDKVTSISEVPYYVWYNNVSPLFPLFMAGNTAAKIHSNVSFFQQKLFLQRTFLPFGLLFVIPDHYQQ